MRNIFVEKLISEAKNNKDLYLLTGDLGYNAFEPFRDSCPKQFINAGVAENNMIGIAAGLALCGKIVCTYSIIPFLIFRSLEQIRNNICHNNLNVKLIGVGGGFSYGNQGISHNTSEDLAIMRSLPNILVLSPGSRLEADLAIKLMLDYNGPVYLRLGKAPEKEYIESIKQYKLGDGIIIKEGNGICLLSTGNITADVVKLAKKLENMGFQVKVISFLSIKPLNHDFIIDIAKNSEAIITIEEHSIIGGLGSAVAEIIMESKYSNILFKRIGLNDKVHKLIGSHNYLKKINGLGVDDMATDIIHFYNNAN